MRVVRTIGVTLTGALIMSAACASTSPGGGEGGEVLPPQQGTNIVVYEGHNFSGRSAVVNQDWPGGGYWDQRIRSVRVPPGYRLWLYDQPGYQGTQTMLASDWSPSPGTSWIGRARSYRIERTDVTPPVGAAAPTGYSEPGFQGRVIGPAQSAPRLPFPIHSIRVPTGWRLLGYSEPDFRGTVIRLTSDWSSDADPGWTGGIHSIQIDRSGAGTSPGTGAAPTGYTEVSYRGRVLGMSQDSPNLAFPIASIRVPAGWRLVVYTEPNYRGKGVEITADWTSAEPSWAPRIRSVRVYPPQRTPR